MPRRPLSLLASASVIAVLLLSGAASAVAATRYAAPGASGAEPCAQASPCSLFQAADNAGGANPGDEVVVEPGQYSNAGSDLGPNGRIVLEDGIGVHGAAGQPPPVVRLDRDPGLLGGVVVLEGDVLSRLELESSTAEVVLNVTGGVVDGVVARGSGRVLSFTCEQSGGLIRDSACLSGSGRPGLGSEFIAIPGSITTTKLRNVTATSAGPVAIDYEATGDAGLNVEASDVIAVSTRRRIIAVGLSTAPHTPGTGARVQVELDHSDYAEVATGSDDAGSSPMVTQPGAGTNITAPPLLAADGYHELPGSPTIDAGATDPDSGAFDVDGGARLLGVAADIGADELLPAGAMSPPPPPKPEERGSGPQPPQTRLTRHSGKHGPTRLARFSFTADQSGSSFECSLDRGPFRGCASPDGVKVRPGAHVFSVRAVGPTGLADPTPVVFHWRVMAASAGAATARR